MKEEKKLDTFNIHLCDVCSKQFWETNPLCTKRMRVEYEATHNGYIPPPKKKTSMRTLFDETIEALAKYDKTFDDVLGVEAGGLRRRLTTETFIKMAKDVKLTYEIMPHIIEPIILCGIEWSLERNTSFLVNDERWDFASKVQAPFDDDPEFESLVTNYEGWSQNNKQNDELIKSDNLCERLHTLLEKYGKSLLDVEMIYATELLIAIDPWNWFKRLSIIRNSNVSPYPYRVAGSGWFIIVLNSKNCEFFEYDISRDVWFQKMHP